MSKLSDQRGSCLCGGVTVKVAQLDAQVGVCHCGMCRKWGGGPLLAVDCGTEVDIEGNSLATFASSEWAERGFCQQCGTHLFWRMRQTGQHIMPAGLFAETEGLVLDHQIFIDKKPEYYAFSNDTKCMTEAEVFAMFASDGN